MKRTTLILSLAAMLMIAAIPAIAQTNNHYDNHNNNNGGGSGVSQSLEQDAESGDVGQSFNVSGSGDNANQCVNASGVANTGNLQNQSGSIQYASDTGDFGQHDIGSGLTVNGTSTVSCDQQVNQAAAAG